MLVFTKPHIDFSPLAIKHLRQLLETVDSYILIQGNKLFSRPGLITKIPVRLRAKLIPRKLGKVSVSEILYAHDISSDFWNQTLMQAFPYAKRICYGDALGLVYSQNYFTSLMFGLRKNQRFSFNSSLVQLKRKFLFPTKKKQLLAQQAILAIPCDPGQDFLKQCQLLIPGKNEVKQCVLDLASALPEFKTYGNELIEKANKSCYLFILSNLTDSKLTTIENEIALYKEILASQVNHDATIIIKPHPAHNSVIFQKIIRCLQEEYDIRVIKNDFNNLPIELAIHLIESCTILSISYSSISIPYLYGKNVRHVLSNQMIKKYFVEEKKDWFIESNNLFLNIIAKLPNWDQQSELSI
ncbi:alpha-2,8-polysialyltransferase family protein [Legionella sp. W10-070]|uniref:alpha-2,8-polysialyltransferase family protein n=1 Tax=unclassified Legionella TaxID=2622702 RepID=UPI001F5F268F|nr:alpha-2,8-polysialyltransferase family protein [Legionella sp. W10-070]MDI9817759.1 alpha-2,8-polysialyltransferase family protein [Legionella sp. PL877]